MDPESATGTGAVEAPADTTTLESAFKEASAQASATTDAPVTKAPDSPKPAATTVPSADQPSGEEPRSNRQIGREAYERGLRDARAEFESEKARLQQEQATANERREFEQLFTDASLPDDGSYETSQRRAQAQQRLGQLAASNRVSQAAYNRGQEDYERTFWSGFEGKLKSEVGLDDAGVTALMRDARSGIDFARRLVDHGKTQEKAVWEQEVAKRDATIEQLRGQLAARRPSPEGANGIRTNGAATGKVESIADAFRLAKAMHAGT